MRRRQAYAQKSAAFNAALEAIPTEPKFYDDMSDKDLRLAFEEIIGRKPGRMKRENILEKLHDACDGRA